MKGSNHKHIELSGDKQTSHERRIESNLFFGGPVGKLPSAKESDGANS